MWINGKGGLLDITQIGVTALVERGGHADDDGVGLFELRKIRGGTKVSANHELLDLILRNMLDIRAAAVEHVHFVRIGIKTGDLVTRLGKAQGQREADVTAADDRHFELGTFEELGFPVHGHGLSCTPSHLTPSGLKSAKLLFPGYVLASYSN